MQGLSLEETAEYCISRIKIAGGINEIFTPSALSAIHTISGGFLRTINNIAVASLMYATERKMSLVDEEAVYQANIEMGFNMKPTIFKCSNDKNEKWIGRVMSLYKYGNLYEMVIESRSRILVIFGKTSQGGFACMPDFGAGCHLVDLKDEFWNTEMLIRELEVVDGITVASAFHVLKDKINI